MSNPPVESSAPLEVRYGLRAPVLAALAIAAAWLATQLRAADPAQAALNLGAAGAGRDLALVGLMLAGVFVAGRYSGLGRLGWVAYPLLVAVGIAWIGGDQFGVPSSSRRVYLAGMIGLLALTVLVRLAVRLDPEPGRWGAVVLALAVTQAIGPFGERVAPVESQQFIAPGVGEPEFPDWVAFSSDRSPRQRQVWLNACLVLAAGAATFALAARRGNTRRVLFLAAIGFTAVAGYQGTELLKVAEWGRWESAFAATRASPFGAPGETWAAHLIDGSNPGGPALFPMILGLPAFVLGLAVILGGIRYAAPSAAVPVPLGVRSLGTRFYAGGLAGCLLTFLISHAHLSADAPPRAALELGTGVLIRSFIWIGAFAAIDRLCAQIPLASRWLTLALVAQLLACAALPTLAEPECLALFALAFGVLLAEPMTLGSGGSRSAWADLPMHLGMAAMVVSAAWPALQADSELRSASRGSRGVPKAEESARGTRARGKNDVVESRAEVARVLSAEVIEPLNRAMRYLPDHPALRREQARWRRRHWEHLTAMGEPVRALERRQSIVQLLDDAEKLSPGHPLNRVESAAANLAFLSDPYAARPTTLARLDEDLAALEPSQGKWVGRMRGGAYTTVFDRVEKRLRAKGEETDPVWRTALDSLAVQRFSREGAESPSRREADRLRAALPSPSPELAAILAKVPPAKKGSKP